jgi:fructosamine-3-kinase
MNIWQWLEAEIEHTTGEAFVLADKNPVSGGDVNQLY